MKNIVSLEREATSRSFFNLGVFALKLSSLRRGNHALWVVFGVLGFAVFAGVGMVVVAALNPEHELPAQYHWEGPQLERDYARAARAAALGVQATLDASGTESTCRLSLRIPGSPPDALMLRLTHATRPSLDRVLTLQRTATGGTDGSVDYVAPCTPPPPGGGWRIELAPQDAAWLVRHQTTGSLVDVTLEGATEGAEARP